ncbi:uncharacterized protein UTRI_03726_B [Ustilago trichophora]|uniref:Chromosome transmission fidelity protein 8 n=1 Tax=Ustilago trichophora TaxID=86804 RepID=A0A5C3E2L8_9BASI|nr:uncharacterized protein UTRI_03726_B [Ustilago trichophora]
MRIHLNLPTASTSGSSSTSNLLSAAPAPLTALTPHGELILIELQGSLEIENQSSSGGQILGTISFEPTRPDRPVLMISHHRLEGKFVNLVRPLAVLEKKVRGGGSKAESVLMDVKNGEKRRAQVDEMAEKVGSVRKARRVEEPDSIEGKGARNSSPPLILSPRRNRDAMDFSSSPPHATPIKARPVARASALDGIDENDNAATTTTAAEEEVVVGEEEEDEPQTAVYYDVVNVIKRKILFSKRPEPIVRLDTTTSPPKA